MFQQILVADAVLFDFKCVLLHFSLLSDDHREQDKTQSHVQRKKKRHTGIDKLPALAQSQVHR